MRLLVVLIGAFRTTPQHLRVASRVLRGKKNPGRPSDLPGSSLAPFRSAWSAVADIRQIRAIRGYETRGRDMRRCEIRG